MFHQEARAKSVYRPAAGVPARQVLPPQWCVHSPTLPNRIRPLTWSPFVTEIAHLLPAPVHTVVVATRSAVPGLSRADPASPYHPAGHPCGQQCAGVGAVFPAPRRSYPESWQAVAAGGTLQEPRIQPTKIWA